MHIHILQLFSAPLDWTQMQHNMSSSCAAETAVQHNMSSSCAAETATSICMCEVPMKRILHSLRQAK